MKITSLSAVAALALAAAANAATVSFTLTSEFSGSGFNPTGPSPWGTATFTDTGANTVQLTLARSTGMTSNEFIRYWLFNLNPAMNPGDLNIAQNTGPTSTNSVRTGSDTDSAFRGDGGSFFDFKFEWPSGNDANRFDGDWVSAVYTLSMSGLDANDFLDLGVGAGNSLNGLYTAAHIQGIPGGGSAWVTGGPGVLVPLPPAAWAGMAGLGMVGLVGWKRRRAAR
ncbi:MAG TPA: hypothetical protein VHN77_14925 [Phycisphaerales bacterium]|nr:hypothetical protein [Phycisphaerales bacterium]